MSLTLNPSSVLGFPRPLTTHVKRTLTLSNPNAQPVAFKVKTTAPKLYCVRPNSGRVDPGETVEVQVVLQALKEEPPLGAKCKDKFLIQSTLITPEKETLPLQDIWSGEPGDEAVQSHKIRVTYLPAEGQTVPEEDEHHVPPVPQLDPESKLGDYTTAVQRPQNGHPPPIPDFGQDDSFHGNQTDAEVHDAPSTPPPAVPRLPPQQPQQPPPPSDPSPPAEPPAVVHVNVHTPPAPAPAPSHVAPVPVAPADPNPELVGRLRDAHAEIERLRKLIASMPEPSTVAPSVATTGVRRRTRALSDDGSTAGAETDVGSYVEEGAVAPEGVPLQVVIIIALGVFITTYLFF